MIIARVIGNVVATQKNERYASARVMLCQPLTLEGAETGVTLIALDSVDAGVGDVVLVVQEGWGASTAATGKAGAAIDSAIVGVVDRIDLLPEDREGRGELSTEQDKIRAVADRIAQRLAGGDADASGARRAGTESDELTQLRAALRELQQRLAHVESHVAHGDDCAQHGHEAGATAPAAEHSRDGGSRQQQQQSRQPQRAGQQFLSSTYVPAAHPSQERFGIDEAVSELVDFFEREKVCSVEPGGKPCDQCGMCSARGF